MASDISKKIKIPKKINTESLINFFKEKKLHDLIDFFYSSKKLSVNEVVSGNLPPYPPMLEDLYRLYQFIVLNKRTTILEFGSGWSSLIFNLALSENKKKYFSQVKSLRRNNPFELFILENQKKYLKNTKEKLNFYKKKIGSRFLNSKVNWNYSEVYMTEINHKFCTNYKKLPRCNPDFIYLDGPNLFTTKNKINNFTVDHKDMMPMVGDILKFEYFLTPGTIIVTDGRTANAQFLNENFKRNWIYKYDEKFDQNLFYLDAECLGKWNKLQLNFYSK